MRNINIIIILMLAIVSFLVIPVTGHTVGNGGSTWQGNATFDNTTQDNGDHYVKVGRWADNFEDNNENWIVFPGKTAMDLSAVQAIGTYSFRMDAENELEYYNYKYNLTSNLTPHTIVVKVYDNGTGNSNLWYVGANNGTDYFMGVDSYGNKVCPSGNTGNFCYRIGNTKYVSSMARQSSGWVTIKYEFNGTHVKGYVNDNLIFTTADSTGLENIRAGNAWTNSGIAYFDEVRVAQTTSGNVTTWHDAGIGNETDRIGVNATTPTNTNYTLWYRQNNTGSFVQVVGVYTGNNTIALSPRYQNTDVRIVLNGNQTATPKLNSITFYTRPGSSGNNPPNIISWGNNKTNNDSLTLTANTSESVKFNATANQTIDTWQWFKDDVSQNNNYNNLTANFSSSGIHTIKVNASNVNGTSNTITWSVYIKELNKYTVGDGGSTWQGNAIFDNTTQDNGDHYVKVGRWADNFEDNNENWIVFPGKTAMDLSTVQAIGTYSFRMDAGNELEYYNYKYNLTSNLTPHTIVVKVYDNGAGNSNLWYVGANNGTDYFMGVDSYGNKVCPSGNTGNFCYRIGNTKYVSSMARQSAGWVTIKYEFNGTHVKGYVNDNLIFTTADSTGLENIRVGNAWSNSGIAYFDEVRVAQTTSGNVTTWHDAGIGNETYRIGVNATTPTNTNYTVWYRENNTDSFYQVGEAYTGNSTIAFSPRYKNTDVRIVLNGDQTTTPKLISITFYTQPVV